MKLRWRIKNMKIYIIAFVLTVLLSIVGMITDQILGLDGNFSIVVSIATIGSIIIYCLDKRK